MKLRELTEAIAGLKFLKPGELRGSYTDQQLRNLGFKLSRNNSWFIPQSRWDYLVQNKLIEDFEITESTSPEATIKAIVADIGHPVSAVYSQLSTMADKFVANKGNLKGFNMIAGGVGSRWYDQFYFNRLQRELYDLVKYYPRHSEVLKQFLSNRPETFSVISRELPETLVQFANKINNKDLTRAASRWIEVRKQYIRTLNQLEADAVEGNDDDEPRPLTQPNVTGQQASQAEQIVADVLRRLPKNVAGDIRNAIARSPNKLLALQQELQRRNITVGEGLSEGWRDWVMGAGIGAAALGGIGAAHDYLSRQDVDPEPQRQVATGAVQQTKPQSLLAKASKPLEKTLIRAAEKAGLTGTELHQFIAQCAHETMDFQTLEELGDNKRFAQKYDMKYNPAKAKELGNIRPGDGIRYKGRGYIQLTGRYNYRDAGKDLGLPLEDHPELAARPDVAVKVALWFWGKRVAPKVNDFASVPKSTKPINPALHGLKSRQAKFDKYSANTVPVGKS